MSISFPQSFSGCSAIEHWEAAGAALVAALANYANSCLALSVNFEQNDTHAKNLAFQIDSALDTHAAIVLQLCRFTAPLSRMRNRVVTPLHHLPEEVLSQIFRHAVYGPRGNEFGRFVGGTPTENRISLIYRRRHNLLSVCSVWRNIISTRAFFWSTILVTRRGIRNQVLETYLQRAGGSSLCLVVTAEETISEHVTSTLSRHVPQIHSLIIQSRTDLVFRRIANMFLSKDVPHSLSELSLRWTGISLRLVGQYESVFPRNSRRGFLPASTLMESIPTLRVSGIYPLWDPARAANLVELQIHNLEFGSEAEMIVCLKSISSAPQLRDLKLFSFYCDRSPANSQGQSVGLRTISFSKLQSLTIGDFHLHDLKIILGSINPGSHRLILPITESSFFIEDEQADSPSTAPLIGALSLAPVDSLLLDEECQEVLQQGTNLFDLLRCIPELKTLKIAGWRISGQLWGALMRRNVHATEDDSGDPEFPRLRSLHLTGVSIDDEECLKTVVKEHGIQRLVLGVRPIPRPSSQDPDEPGELQSLSFETVSWLRVEVPEFNLVDPGYYPPDFDTSGWERDLW